MLNAGLIIVQHPKNARITIHYLDMDPSSLWVSVDF
jgi:hypothetical protein